MKKKQIFKISKRERRIKQWKKYKHGEYVRTKNGQIDIFEETDENYMFARCKNKTYWKLDIVKHSKTRSEVVDVGDYVNGKRIHKIDRGKNYCYLYYGNCKTFADYQIKTIWTKEQLKDIEYNVEGEKI